ncbi:MAG: PD-(D/E)XK nuclease family protein [Faecalibacterium sp.]|jgi:ATP-dependent helicase/nuclease subunit B|nr:PD-(D/E)XK nuclease family protein [Faecalibacterium sp.]
MLQWIEGPSGSGKTTLLYQKVQTLAAAGRKSILLVPEQFTSSTENRIYRTLGEQGAGMVESLSFTSLSERILDTLGGAAVKTLTDAGRAVLVRRALAGLTDEIQYYRRHRRSAAFCTMAAETIDELKSAGISAAALRALAPGCGAEKDKLAELALIYEGYEALLAQTGMDPADRLTLAADRLEGAVAEGSLPAFLAGREVFVDEFDTFNAPKKRLMAALMAAAPNVTVALCADGRPAEAGDVSLFSGGRKLALALERLARENGVRVAAPIVLREDVRHKEAPGLAALAEYLIKEGASAGDSAPFSEDAAPQAPEAIRLYAAPGREEEARAAAAAIRHLVRAGTRYQKIAVVCRDAAQYRAAVRYEFRLAGIPLFCDEATTPEFSAPANAVKALLGLVRGADYGENMVALAKTGLCGLTEAETCALDNYVYTWTPRRADWALPFARSPQGFGEASRVTQEEQQSVAEAEAARQKLVPPVEKLRAKCQKADTAAVSKALYFCLKELGAEESQAALVAALRAGQGIPAAEEAAREWNVVMELLNQMTLLLGSDALDPAEYLELFTLLLRTSDLGHIPETLDAVIFTSAGKMRLADPDYVFMLGLAEGEFPAAPGETGLLSHADRDALMAQDVELPDCFENRVVREQICFYKAMTAPKRGLWLSWPEGAGLPLTSALAPAAKVFSFLAPQLEAADYAATPAAALDRLGSVWNLDNAETASLYAALQRRGETRDTLSLLRTAAADAPRKVTDLSAMERVLGPKMHLSPSQMEKYYSCRYGYFLQYVLGLRPRQKAKLTPNQSGSLMHWVLQMALDPNPANPYAALRSAPFEQMDDAQLATLASQLTDAYVALYMPDDTARFAYLIRRVKRSLAGLLCYLRDEQRQSSFRPAACEARIGDEPGCLPPQVYRLPDGHAVEIIGTIDRVDTWTDSAARRWVRVVDYKTGAKAFDLKEVYCGLDCQMLLYLFTLTRDASGRFTGAQPAGVLYLLADPAPVETTRDASAPAPYKLDGVVQENAAVYEAMDADETGMYLPFNFQNGKPNPRQKKKLADPEKLGRIERHLDGLVQEMACELYAGEIDATPLCTSARDACAYCDFAAICCHEPGKNERALNAPDDPFGEEEAAPEQGELPGAAAPDEKRDDAPKKANTSAEKEEPNHA